MVKKDGIHFVTVKKNVEVDAENYMYLVYHEISLYQVIKS